MHEVTMREALREAIMEEMQRSPRMIVMGEDIMPGAFGVHAGLGEMFPGRFLETPISEAAIVGTALGTAMTGGPVIAEIMYSDFLAVCMDEIVNQAAKIRYMTGAQARVPLVIRSPIGMTRGVAAQHSQSLEAWFAHIPGLRVAMPSTPADAKGLLKTALRGEDPVLFFEQKLLYGEKGQVPDGEHLVPFGAAMVARPGDDVTVVATGLMVSKALEAAAELQRAGISIEVVDPRTVSPIDFAEPELAEHLSSPGYKGRPERAFILTLEAYDWNCPQHITPRFTAAEVAAGTSVLRERLAEAEAEVKVLREQIGRTLLPEITP